MISGTSGSGTAAPPSVWWRLRSLHPSCVIGWGPLARSMEGNVAPQHTHSLTRARRALQNNAFVLLLRFFLGLALAAVGLFSRAGRGSGSRRRPAPRRRPACCAASVCLRPLRRLLLSLLDTGTEGRRSINSHDTPLNCLERSRSRLINQTIPLLSFIS